MTLYVLPHLKRGKKILGNVIHPMNILSRDHATGPLMQQDWRSAARPFFNDRWEDVVNVGTQGGRQHWYWGRQWTRDAGSRQGTGDTLRQGKRDTCREAGNQAAMNVRKGRGEKKNISLHERYWHACQHAAPPRRNHVANFVSQINRLQPRGREGRQVAQGHRQGARGNWWHSGPRIILPAGHETLI